MSPQSPAQPTTEPSVRHAGASKGEDPSRPTVRRGRPRGDDGMTTAEYAVGTVAACGFAALLYEVVTSGTVRGLVTGVITHALQAVA